MQIIFLPNHLNFNAKFINLPPSFYSSKLTGNTGKAIRLQATAPAQKKAH